MKTLGERLRYRREKLKLSQPELARASGLTQATISFLESGRNKKSKDITKIASALNCSAVWLAQGAGPEELRPAQRIDSESGGFVAVQRGSLQLSAGVSGFAIDYENNDAPPIFFRAAWFTARGFRAERLLALKVSGASMEPGLCDGDTVIINFDQVDPIDGEVFAVNYEGECVIKRMKRNSGAWWLSSDNADQRRFQDKACTEDVFILGRVVYKSSERI